MNTYHSGPATDFFSSIRLHNAMPVSQATSESEDSFGEAMRSVPTGQCVFRGIPFEVCGVVPVANDPVSLDFAPFTGNWVVFLHAAGTADLRSDGNEIISPMKGRGALNEIVARYIVKYSDGITEEITIRRRHEINSFIKGWGENTLEAVPYMKPHARRQHHEQTDHSWGRSQTRVAYNHYPPWLNQLYAWENRFANKPIESISCVAEEGESVYIFGMSAGNTRNNPLRWERRKKALLNMHEILSPEIPFDPAIDEIGNYNQIQIDLGTIISAGPRSIYAESTWEDDHNNQQPEVSGSEILIEYTAHEEACFHIAGGIVVPATGSPDSNTALFPVESSYHRINLRIVEKGSSVPVPVKLHVHGEKGEYLAPVDRHRIPNSAWFEDYSVDFIHTPASGNGPNGLPLGNHYCTYISGETTIDVPVGSIYVEVSKGYEISPIRRVFEIDSGTSEITVELDRALSWRERGWVSADTHVHFLSPATALIEGSAEGVNVVNLLASQWGELMTNVGDFDGKSTWGSKESGGDGEYLVRVGTENRQHVMGHISLLGYEGPIIAPMTTGGPDESALGDPIEILLTEWARQCKKQKGVVIVPHFPNPRLENAAAIVDGSVDGVEMTSWGNLYSGIDPYSLSDWYRYLNCGYRVAAVGGTDKMSANTAVGTARTYARLSGERDFSFEEWRKAVESGNTFVTYGPLIEFSVEGNPMGSSIDLPASGGTVDISWEVASVTIPVTRVDLVINGRVAESDKISGDADGGIASGSWRRSVTESSWAALLVRGRYPERDEVIAAHGSSVAVNVAGSELYVEHDAVSILEQIEGSLAYLDTIGTRAEIEDFRRMRSVLVSIHRKLHNRMHRLGFFHEHNIVEDHEEHRR